MAPLPGRQARLGRAPRPGGDGRLAAVLLLAAGSALWHLVPHIVYCVEHRFDTPAWTGDAPDLDTVLIHDGLLRAQRFGDTLRWWSGPWVGQVAFYRPLASYVFWLEWKAFGDGESLYGIPAAAAHLAAALLFTALVYRLAVRYRVVWPALAGLGGAWGFLGFLSTYRLKIDALVLQWKNQPDALAAAACFAALLCYLRAQERRRGALTAAVAWYLVGCGFKEIVIPLPLVCLALEPALWRWSSIGHATSDGPSQHPTPNTQHPHRGAALRRLATVAGAAAAFLAVRACAIGGLGFTYGSNRAWVERTLVHLVGPFEPMVVHGQWLGNLMGVWAFAMGLLLLGRPRQDETAPTRPARAGRALLAATGGLLGWTGLGWIAATLPPAGSGRAQLSTESLATGLLFCFQRIPLTTALGTALFLAAGTVMALRCRPVLLLGVVWTVAFLAPLALSSGPIHRYYLPQAGYLLVYACAAGIVAPLLFRGVKRWPDHSMRL